ncbi:RE1-silencing transcription factor-like [Choloepus didactylus]|uniref:RE1-silencing transcription factor-like n=1 Tax=Choloepus didactylus TaxID=27675 RepID=UPI00189FDF7E|nr:RE1-silencing transcription factor-like [Choloepus didactylus]
MATQIMGQSSGGGGLFTGSANIGMALPNDMYDLHDLSKAELAAPQLIMLANVALTGEVNGNYCDYLVGEERQMAELMPVGDNNFSDSDGEGLEESPEIKGEPNGMESMELGNLELSVIEPQPVFEVSAAPEIYNSNKDLPTETPGAEDKSKNLKTKPFCCKPCQYEAESEEQFVHHVRVYSAKKHFVEESAEKQAKAKESGSPTAEKGDFSKGPIHCDRCGYNTYGYHPYIAHLKHHTRAWDNELVCKCIICMYTTVSEYHWRKHLRNHFPRKNTHVENTTIFQTEKNNYVQHVRIHTGKRIFVVCKFNAIKKKDEKLLIGSRQWRSCSKQSGCKQMVVPAVQIHRPKTGTVLDHEQPCFVESGPLLPFQFGAACGQGLEDWMLSASKSVGWAPGARGITHVISLKLSCLFVLSCTFLGVV